MYFCGEQYKVASCLLCSCSCNLGFHDKGRLGRGERATSGVVAGENLPFCANKYSTFNMVITQKKNHLPSQWKCLQCRHYEKYMLIASGHHLKSTQKNKGRGREEKRKSIFPPLPLFYFKSAISSLGIIFWLTPSVSSSKMVGEHYSHGKICLLCKL